MIKTVLLACLIAVSAMGVMTDELYDSMVAVTEARGQTPAKDYIVIEILKPVVHYFAAATNVDIYAGTDTPTRKRAEYATLDSGCSVVDLGDPDAITTGSFFIFFVVDQTGNYVCYTPQATITIIEDWTVVVTEYNSATIAIQTLGILDITTYLEQIAC